jgi:hypothetical protein
MLNKLKVKCKSDNVPIDKSNKFSYPTIQKPQIEVQNNTVCILLCQTEYYSYLIKRKNAGQNTTIYDGSWQSKICDNPKSGAYVYSITPYYYDGEYHFGKEYILPSVIINSDNNSSSESQLPSITQTDWYNQ